uniref:Putative secreted protein n=1 Tax=Anopheles darlingi TaxID=43151 RepID=A0A2M4DQ08_ANODA
MFYWYMCAFVCFLGIFCCNSSDLPVFFLVCSRVPLCLFSSNLFKQKQLHDRVQKCEVYFQKSQKVF